VLNRYVNVFNKAGTNEEYYGYADVKYHSPVLTQNIISNSEFKSDSGWRVVDTQADGNTTGKIETVVGRFDDKGEFVDCLTELDPNKIYHSYLHVTLDNKGALINTGPCDNRVTIGNMIKGEEWALILKSEKGEIPSNITLGEYIYTSEGNYYKPRTDYITFTSVDDAITTTDSENNIIKIFKVDKNEYSKETFKRNSELRLMVSGEGDFYLSKACLFKVVRDANNNIILPES
jgi:hypothetical protein